ncbi:hypothetical protein PENSPDRAFT_692121 [Peniophora sp. CONT]|nr:hypothetical protein PENSPDRAFT_692121 [Peniophora sp. CONT]
MVRAPSQSPQAVFKAPRAYELGCARGSMSACCSVQTNSSPPERSNPGSLSRCFYHNTREPPANVRSSRSAQELSSCFRPLIPQSLCVNVPWFSSLHLVRACCSHRRYSLHELSLRSCVICSVLTQQTRLRLRELDAGHCVRPRAANSAQVLIPSGTSLIVQTHPHLVVVADATQVFLQAVNAAAVADVYALKTQKSKDKTSSTLEM